MKRRGKIRLSAFLAAALLTLFGLWTESRLRLADSQTRLEYSYRRALNDLTDYVYGMSSVLEKAPYVSTAPMQTGLSAKLLEQSGGAKAALSVLPFSRERSDQISRFLSQAGDYALSLSRRAAAGETLEARDVENLETLKAYAEKLTQALQSAQARLNVENASIGETKSFLDNLETLQALPTLDDDLDEVAQEFSQFPSLLYDGPFSDHIRLRTSLFLENEPEIDRREAARRAAGFLGCQESELAFTGEGGGNLPVFSFSCDDSHVNITKAGGKIAYFKKSGTINAANLTYEEALKKAKKLLDNMGVGSVKESYYIISDNLCTINFSALAETGFESAPEAVCYPDLIKVTLELEQGGMVEYDAAGYLMNHRERRIDEPSLSQEEAAQAVSPLLTVKRAALALIPTPGLDEALCWEFLCSAPDGKELLAYINVSTGLEEQLYLLQKDDHGVLVL